MRISDWSSDVCSSDLYILAEYGRDRATDGLREHDQPEHLARPQPRGQTGLDEAGTHRPQTAPELLGEIGGDEQHEAQRRRLEGARTIAEQRRKGEEADEQDNQ